ncbi:MAG: outer membrane protein assembly factor BamA [Candidatus Rokuibacteriota bacterium]|nr:MAG: outer membrane protein assembly factor BamA [Candidatus Rokubacteria bacterium]
MRVVRGGALLSVFFALLLAQAGAGRAQTPPSESQPRPIIIKDIAVQGNRRVQEAVILGRVSVKIGTPFQPTRLAEDIRNVFALGFFDDVQLRVEDFEGGVKLVFAVVERPFVRDIIFTGNKKFDASALQEKIDLKLGSVYNPVEVNRAAEKLKEHYEGEGYFEVEVTPDVQRLPDGDVTVTFRIAEGRKITIDRIVIEGAHGLTPKQVKDAMGTQEREFFILRGTVQRQKLDEDVDRIVQLYNDHGYIQARVESSDVQVDRIKARAAIRIVVVEGPQFKVGGVDVTGTGVLPVEEIRRQILLKPGDVFSRSKLRESVKKISDVYGTIGRASADVNPSIVQDMPNLKINVTFEINEGPEVFVERINVAGNTRSEEKILRREIPMAEGDLFTTPKLARARQKLVNLNYFDTVNTTTAPGSAKDKIIVNIDVTEKPTGIFSLGGGYSSQDGIIGTLNLSQNNFLGRGWIVSLRLVGGGKVQNGTLGFTEPWLFDRPLSAGFDLFNNRRVFTDYTANSLGGDVRFGHPLGDYSRWNALYRVSQDKISGVNSSASVNLLDQEGTHLTSLIGVGLARDTRDSVFETTRGSNASIGLDFAGVGFGEQWFRTLASTSYFLPAWRDHVVGARVMGGYSLGWGRGSVPLFERFFLGGPNSIRSFKAQDVSPKDSSGTRIGGNIELVGNVEYTVPLFYGIRAAAFFDVGNVWGPDISAGEKFDITDLHYASGLGVRWVSPFGPIRVDYGVNLNPAKGEKFGNFHFSVGSAF